MAAITTYHCDICKSVIDTDRTQIAVTIGAITGFPTDISTGRVVIDLCTKCREELTSDLAARRLTAVA
jgi:hypothetical protein